MGRPGRPGVAGGSAGDVEGASDGDGGGGGVLVAGSRVEREAPPTVRDAAAQTRVVEVDASGTTALTMRSIRAAASGVSGEDARVADAGATGESDANDGTSWTRAARASRDSTAGRGEIPAARARWMEAALRSASLGAPVIFIAERVSACPGGCTHKSGSVVERAGCSPETPDVAPAGSDTGVFNRITSERPSAQGLRDEAITLFWL